MLQRREVHVTIVLQCKETAIFLDFLGLPAAKHLKYQIPALHVELGVFVQLLYLTLVILQ